MVPKTSLLSDCPLPSSPLSVLFYTRQSDFPSVDLPRHQFALISPKTVYLPAALGPSLLSCDWFVVPVNLPPPHAETDGSTQRRFRPRHCCWAALAWAKDLASPYLGHSIPGFVHRPIDYYFSGDFIQHHGRCHSACSGLAASQ